MLFAYSIRWNTGSLPAELSRNLELVNRNWLPEGQGLAPVIDRTARAMRGYETEVERGHMLAIVHALRELSARVPYVSVMLSGGHGLPPTTVRAGQFMLFGDAYEQALARRVGWATPHERLLRVPPRPAHS